MPRILWLAAEIAFAPFPDNDVPKAEAYMRHFYQFIGRFSMRILMWSACQTRSQLVERPS